MSVERGKDEYLWPDENLIEAYRRDPQWSQGSWPGCDPKWQTRAKLLNTPAWIIDLCGHKPDGES